MVPTDETHADVAASLDGLLTVKVWTLLDIFERRLEDELSALGMTISTFRLIGELMRAPDGLSQKELAQRLRIRPPSVSAAVTRLVKDQVVERTPDPHDARACRVRLASAASLLPGAELFARIEADILADLTPDEQRQVAATLDALAVKLNTDTEQTP